MFWWQTLRSFEAVLRGRARGDQERIIALAHQTEQMAREKRLRPLSHYLRRVGKAEASATGMDVLGMARRLEASGKAIKVTRIGRAAGAAQAA